MEHEAVLTYIVTYIVKDDLVSQKKPSTQKFCESIIYFYGVFFVAGIIAIQG